MQRGSAVVVATNVTFNNATLLLEKKPANFNIIACLTILRDVNCIVCSYAHSHKIGTHDEGIFMIKVSLKEMEYFHGL